MVSTPETKTAQKHHAKNKTKPNQTTCVDDRSTQTAKNHLFKDGFSDFRTRNLLTLCLYAALVSHVVNLGNLDNGLHAIRPEDQPEHSQLHHQNKSRHSVASEKKQPSNHIQLLRKKTA